MKKLEDFVHKDFKSSENSLSYIQSLKHKRRKVFVEKISFVKRKKIANKIHIADGSISWEQALLLNEKWINYVRNLIDLKRVDRMEVSQSQMDRMKFIFHKVDWHGAHITVKKSQNSCLLDICGIVLLESKNTFKILVKGGSIKVIPKINSLFEVKFDDYKITCYGEQLAIKPYERFNKKIKKIIPPRDI